MGAISHALPRHIAIIMDGNGRWAKQQGRPRLAGHKAGAEAVRRAIESCIEFGIETLSLFAFSSENWRRPRSEVNALMDLFLRAMQKEASHMQAQGIQFRVIGNREKLSEKLQKKIHELESLTQNNNKLTLLLAISYGGRDDIVQATKQLAQDVAAGRLDPASIDENHFAEKLSFADQPDPDLFIRTSGEYRISNFFLWQMAYTELYFTDVFWPDFTREHFLSALQDFSMRGRRYGHIGEQLNETV